MKPAINQLRQLSDAFASEDIKLLAKPLHANAPAEYCETCGGHHGQPAQHIQYVGHAALTKRLLAVDPLWDWRPLAAHEDGTPRFDAYGGLWIKLTVCGMTRLGYGHADGKVGGNAIKETIGDALRNAAMRFGAALSLWHQAELNPRNQLDVATHVHETPAAATTTAPDKPLYPQDLFDQSLPAWASLITHGQTSHSIRHKLETTYTLTESQLAALAALGEPTHANH
ncbi:hypothetical protein GCM10009007_20660 [Formosimonas limnophila]|uniref:Uncharacterized protein n=1 Tax=Formosimonas limnophila TaxID=1384487 RepID=A0A8J3CP66_9BURK|nr:hypothetical protein [Formosimonas limnophila]GHA79533.1 hypothetical protein GCM10009007_20660 [Formosimonas limnophila]